MRETKYLDIQKLKEENDFKYKEITKFVPDSDTPVIVMFELGQLGIGCWDNYKKRFYNVNDPFGEKIDDQWLWVYSRVDRWKVIA